MKKKSRQVISQAKQHIQYSFSIQVYTNNMLVAENKLNYV